MGKVFFIFLFGFCLMLNSFAQEEPSDAGVVSAQTRELKTCKAKIARIAFEERTKDYPARVEVVDERGQRLVFVVESAVAVFAKNGTTMYLRKVASEDTVVIEYVVAKKNRKIVRSLRVVEE